jgi:hypothetical protein
MAPACSAVSVGGYGRARRLHHDGHPCADADEQEATDERLPTQPAQLESARHALHAGLQRVDADEDQAEPGKRESERGGAVASEQSHQRANADSRHRDSRDAELQPEHRYEPGRARGTDVGPEDDADSLGERNESGADEADGRECRCARGLNERGDERT